MRHSRTGSYGWPLRLPQRATCSFLVLLVGREAQLAGGVRGGLVPAPFHVPGAVSAASVLREAVRQGAGPSRRCRCNAIFAEVSRARSFLIHPAHCAARGAFLYGPSAKESPCAGE